MPLKALEHSASIMPSQGQDRAEAWGARLPENLGRSLQLISPTGVPAC